MVWVLASPTTAPRNSSDCASMVSIFLTLSYLFGANFRSFRRKSRQLGSIKSDRGRRGRKHPGRQTLPGMQLP
jgi:hypothetical protein